MRFDDSCFALAYKMRVERTSRERRENVPGDGGGVTKQASEQQNVIEAIKEGFAYVWSRMVLRVFFLLVVAINFLVLGPVTVGIPVLASQRLLEGAAAFGIIMSAFGAGSLLGIILSSVVPAPKPEHFGTVMLLVGSSLGVGVALMPLFASTAMVAVSRALNDVDGPCMIIAGSGMCSGGRILHHLKHNLWRPQTLVLIVGYQAAGTLGRLLIEGARRVRIFDEEIAVKAAIHTLGGFSAHAGQSELLAWLAPMAPTHPQVLLTHGEERARIALARRIAERFEIAAELPLLNDAVMVGSAGG